MESQSSATEPGNSRSLLWAIAEFREDIERLIEEQKTLVLTRPAEPIAAEALPIPVLNAPPPPVEAQVAEPDPPPARKFARTGSAPWPRDNPSPPILAPVAEPVAAEPIATDPGRPEDARQRLDALAAKLLDRRLKQSNADPSSRQGER